MSDWSGAWGGGDWRDEEEDEDDQQTGPVKIIIIFINILIK